MASTTDLDGLPEPGPPFRVGESIGFFPAELGPTSRWLAWGYAVIDVVNEEAETCGFHFVDDPGRFASQGMENIARRTATYDAWRAAWQVAFASSEDEAAADQATNDLWLRVLAEHPIHGPTLGRHNSTPRQRA
jgi:hypothetical protein